MNTATIITFLVYLAGMLAIGVIAYRATRGLSDYILGGRSLGSAVAALSAGASDMSGWLLLGLPGALYASGLNQIWIAVGLTIGAFLNWQYVAAPLRRYSESANDSITLPDFLENRLNDHSRILRVVSALVILLFFTIYTSAGLVGGAILFEKSFDMTYHSALLLGAAVIVSYTFIGGFLAVSWTDFVQGILMFIALLVVPTYAFHIMGGWDGTLEKIASMDATYLDAFHSTGVIGAISLAAWGLGYFGQPHILARFMAIRSPAEVPQARFIGMTWMVAGLYGAIFTGLAAFAYFADNPLEDSETAFIALSQTLLNPWIAGILLAAILSAIMSTVDSQLLVSSSALTEDFYKSFVNPKAGQSELVWIGRAAVVGIALIAVALAWNRDSSVLDLVSYAWAGFGAAFGPLVLLSLLWRGLTRHGAIAGMLGGAVTVVIWKQLSGGLFDLYEIVPGFLIGGGLAILISIWVGGPDEDIKAEFDRI